MKFQRQKYIFVFTNSAVKQQHVLFANECLLCKILITERALILVYILKKSLAKIMKSYENGTSIAYIFNYTPVGPKFVFKKIKFKVLHYIQHDFIFQRLGSVKVRLARSKVLLLIRY